MNWDQLLATTRLCRPGAAYADGRTEFQRDNDRIIFSHAFRRLANKTQVHPLSANDHVHTRLTHSIEVMSVGRSLGNLVGAKFMARGAPAAVTPDALGYAVQAACLAHDIGNPPFGHAGEESIQRWFAAAFARGAGHDMTATQQADLTGFEGNAQGFRLLTQLENNKWEGGLELTHAALGTFTKYPRAAGPRPADNYAGGKKHGYFDAERGYFEEVATALGLTPRSLPGHWSRHPLAFLVEAADDICYGVIDIEDGYELGYIRYDEAVALLESMSGPVPFRAGMTEWDKVRKYRAWAIRALVDAAVDAFMQHEAALLDGTFSADLLSQTEHGPRIEAATTLARDKIYWSERKTQLEIAGNEILCGLLDLFGDMVADLGHAGWDAGRLVARSQKLARLVPNGFAGVANSYDAWLRVTDFISGMTDRYALDLYRKLKGIAI